MPEVYAGDVGEHESKHDTREGRGEDHSDNESDMDVDVVSPRVKLMKVVLSKEMILILAWGPLPI